MPRFQWEGVNRSGQSASGVMVADNADAVGAALRRQRIRSTKIARAKKGMQIQFFQGKVDQLVVSIFTRQFSVMIDAGLPLVQCLEILSGQADDPTFAEVLDDVRRDVEGGSTLADAMRQHERAFTELYCNMVAAGEAGGILDVILRRLAEYLEKAVKLKAAVRSASIYPTIIITVATVVVFIILWKVIPTFASLFAGLGAQLPMPTRIVVAASNFVANYTVFVVGGVIGSIVAVRQYHKTDGGERVLDGIVLKMPVIGMIMRKIAVARFCRTLGTLVASGVPILDGLEITAKTAGNRVIKDAIMETRKSIEAGKTIAKPLEATTVFPPMVTQMISVGEETGALDTMLSKIADFYEDEVDTAVDNLMALLEPVMIVFLGVVIGGIVISMYLPMFELINKI
ncbi:MAG: type II secretion system F family protein [Acidobacteria bacterium]|nr:type II secretion system F family protein [Acidobacteriota bacterium]